MLGDKIRKIRKAEGMTAAALAEKAGISESYVSQLERGMVDPSVSLLRRLAFSLNVSVASFFDEDGPAPIITRLEDRVRDTSGNGEASFSWISPEADDLRLEMAELTIKPASCLQAPANSHHVCLYLTEGSLTVHYGDTTATLAEGDSIFIPADSTYELTGGPQETKAIICVSKGGRGVQ